MTIRKISFGRRNFLNCIAKKHQAALIIILLIAIPLTLTGCGFIGAPILPVDPAVATPDVTTRDVHQDKQDSTHHGRDFIPLELYLLMQDFEEAVSIREMKEIIEQIVEHLLSLSYDLEIIGDEYAANAVLQYIAQEHIDIFLAIFAEGFLPLQNRRLTRHNPVIDLPTDIMELGLMLDNTNDPALMRTILQELSRRHFSLFVDLFSMPVPPPARVADFDSDANADDVRQHDRRQQRQANREGQDDAFAENNN